MLDHRPRSATGPRGSARSKTIGVLSLDPTPHGKALLLSGIQCATGSSDYVTSIVTVPVVDRRSLLAAAERLRRLAVQGIIVVAPPGAAVGALVEISSDIPLVAVGAGPAELLSVVKTDHYAGAVAATRHVLELGHRTVFHIAGPAHLEDAVQRREGWRDTLLTAGAEIPSPMIGDGSPRMGYELGRRLSVRSEVTAIFAANDQMALGVLRALSEAGRRVPQDVSIVGFDGIPEGEFFRPPLTTVRQNYAAIGQRSFDLLQNEIDSGGSAKLHETIPAELIVRASTAPAD
jgi:DNA-binding LacI/PurR family transcriptional regulator